MKDILDMLYYGDVIPSEQPLRRGSDHQVKLDTVVKVCDELRQRLDDESRRLFDEYREAYSVMDMVAVCDVWKQGFKLGLRIGVAVMEDAGGVPLITSD